MYVFSLQSAETIAQVMDIAIETANCVFVTAFGCKISSRQIMENVYQIVVRSHLMFFFPDLSRSCDPSQNYADALRIHRR